MRVSVLGAGNGGLAVAGFLSREGHQVSVWSRNAARLNAVREAGGVQLAGVAQGFGSVMCHDHLPGCIHGSEIILVTTTADAHGGLAMELSKTRVSIPIVLMPGRTGGVLEFKAIAPACHVSEAQSLVFACRAQAHVATIYGVKKNVLVSTLPDQRWPDELSALFDGVTRGHSVLDTSLANMGAVLHPALLLARLDNHDTAGKFYDQLSTEMEESLLKLDMERVQLAEAFGVETPTLMQWLVNVYPDSSGASLAELMNSIPAYREIASPTSSSSRYITEDVPTGLVPLCELGRAAGLPMPNMNNVIDRAVAVTGVDWRIRGRTLRSMGLEGLSRGEILSKLEGHR